MLLRLNYVVVYCSDMSRSVAFYRDQLGFPLKFESPKWSEFHTGPATLALHLAGSPAVEKWTQGAIQAAQAHPSFEVLDLQKFYEEKRGQGVQFSLPPTDQEFGPKLAVLLDPDGLPIAVTQERR